MQNGKIIIFFVMTALFICIFLNNNLPSINNMEARNYITAREILENGSWLLPTMNGEPRIAKPPLPTWITALAMVWAGTDANLTTNRIPAGICGALMALFTFLLARRVSGSKEIAVSSVLILATGLLFLWSVRRNIWDIYTHMAMTGAIWALTEAFMRKEGKNLFFALFSFFMAFSFCSKGPIAFGVMFIPFMVSYCIVYGTKGLRENKWGLAFGLAFSVILASSWPYYVYLHTPQNALAVASKEATNWFTYQIEAPWYYLLNLHWVSGIWLTFLLYATVAPFIQKNWSKEEKLYVYWFILIILILSVIPEKKVRYLLPAVIPGSIITAIAVFRLREAGSLASRVVYGPFSFIVGIACFAGAGALLYYFPVNIAMIPGAVALGIAGLVIVSDFLRKRTKNTHLAVIAAMCLLIVLIAPLRPKLVQKDPTLMLMGLREIPELKGRDFYFLGSPAEEIIYAAGRKVRSIEPGQIPTLKENRSMAVIISEAPVNEKYLGLTLLDTIRTKEWTLYMYSFQKNG